MIHIKLEFNVCMGYIFNEAPISLHINMYLSVCQLNMNMLRHVKCVLAN